MKYQDFYGDLHTFKYFLSQEGQVASGLINYEEIDFNCSDYPEDQIYQHYWEVALEEDVPKDHN